MVMATDMEEDGAMEGVGESEGEVDEFDLAELRREFAGQTEAGEEGRKSDSEGEEGGSEGTEEEESEEPSSEGEPFASDRERYQAVVRAAREHGLGIDDLEELERAESDGRGAWRSGGRWTGGSRCWKGDSRRCSSSTATVRAPRHPAPTRRGSTGTWREIGARGPWPRRDEHSTSKIFV